MDNTTQSNTSNPSQSTPVQQPVSSGAQSIPDLQKFNWGAFGLNWIWAIGNQTWIGLLALIPGVNVIMMFILGFRGNEWAWKNKEWQSVEHFERVQRIWRNTFFGILIAALLLFVALFVAGLVAPQQSEVEVEDQNVTSRMDRELYSHPQYGFSMEYPEGWEVRDDFYTAITFLGPMETGIAVRTEPVSIFDSAVYVGSQQDFIDESATLESYVQSEIESYKNNLPGYKLINVEQLEVNGRDAWLIQSRSYPSPNKLEGEKYPSIKLITLAGDYFYHIFGDSHPDAWEEYEPVLRSSLLSFEVGSVSTTDTPTASSP